MPQTVNPNTNTPALDAGGPIRRSYEARIADVLPGERSVVSILNTDAIDQFKTVIDPMGGDFRSFEKNPVVLWEHGLDPVRGRLPVARSGWIKPRKSERDIIAKTIFRDDEFGRLLFGMYQDGTLKGFSLGAAADPTRSSPPTPAEIRARPELADCRMMYRGWRLDEYSCVAVPANTQALALAVSRGLWVPDEVRALLPPAEDLSDLDLPPLPPREELPPLIGRRLNEVLEQRRAAIRAYARGELDDLKAQFDLRRGIV